MLSLLPPSSQNAEESNLPGSPPFQPTDQWDGDGSLADQPCAAPSWRAKPARCSRWPHFGQATGWQTRQYSLPQAGGAAGAPRVARGSGASHTNPGAPGVLGELSGAWAGWRGGGVPARGATPPPLWR